MNDVQFNMMVNLTTNGKGATDLYTYFGNEESTKDSLGRLFPEHMELQNMSADCTAYVISPPDDNIGAAKEAEDLLRVLHAQLNTVLAACNHNEDIVLKDPANKALYKAYAALIEQLEFALQRARQWPELANKHVFWYTPRACTCPKKDNSEMTGFARIISEDCPMHGEVKEKLDADPTEEKS